MTFRSVRKRSLFGGSCCAFALTLSHVAAADGFAAPPDDATIVEERNLDQGDRAAESPVLVVSRADSPPSSTVRLHVGPSLRVSEGEPAGGLFAAVDVGQRAAGARLSATWVGVGADNGMSQYTGELWVDFAHEERLHPIIGAGAGVARLDRKNVNSAEGALDRTTVGIGVLRGSLEYGLPVAGTDARAAIDVIGSVPAIRSEDAPKNGPWLLVVASVAVGF